MTDSLDAIGFYTLSDARTRRVAARKNLPIARAEVLLTGRCNFRCPYCRRVGGRDADLGTIERMVMSWIRDHGVEAMRFSGGEPTLYPWLARLVRLASGHIGHVAISSNGAADWSIYEALLSAGANDFSISLDACCAADGDVMAGGIPGAWDKVVANIRRLAARVYTTVGIVLTAANIETASNTILLAHDLGVADIRVIPAAQGAATLSLPKLPAETLEHHPILRWRFERMRMGAPVRGLRRGDAKRCSLALDDVAVMDGKHYPCVIYMREGGKPIGEIGPSMMADREAWSMSHDPHKDPICSRQCLDFCRAHNSAVERFSCQRTQQLGTQTLEARP